ncbi:MAG TPA: hypothetical protein VHZ24_17845 [Pirellulales bacterium]|jgi:hypothetical protein|nr:hypothetical protein [Pirellulales bacterium]
MKVAFISESDGDEAALAIIVERLLNETIQHISLKARPNGWPNVFGSLAAIYRHLYYQTDADGLVLVVDSDDTLPHALEHGEPGRQPADCRLCLLKSELSRLNANTTALPNRKPLRTAIGLGVPSVEAWYLAGADPHVNEATWARTMGQPSRPYDRRALKRKAYGTDRLPARAVEKHLIAARELVSRLDAVERLFPCGFGALAADLRAWLS